MGASGMSRQSRQQAGYMNAMEAAGEAEIVTAGRHIISLLSHANVGRIIDLGDPADIDLATALAKAKDDRLKAVSAC